MAEIVSVHVPICEVRQEGNKWMGYITSPWFRYFVPLVGPNGASSVNTVLHGGPNPTFSAVDLTADVTGMLPIANGGTGTTFGMDMAHVTGTLPLVNGGTGLSAGPSSVHSVLHADAGLNAVWGQVNLQADVFGVLPTAEGGTGTSAPSSGSAGGVVLQSHAVLSAPSISGAIMTQPVLDRPQMLGPQPDWLFFASDAHVVSVTAAPTTLLSDFCGFFVIHDQTSHGMAMGGMDFGGVYTAFNTLSNITLAHVAGTGLTAVVTAGANPRDLSVSGWMVGLT